ncbi:MAG: FecR family protein [SAR324 cluster bacterium]|nr:FecR family protein [SAR324 cluster bacterium]
MRFSIITCLFFLILFIQPVAAEEAELELELGLVKIMRAGKALVFSEKGSKIPLLLKDEIQTGANSKAQIRLPGKDETIKLGSRSFFGLDNLTEDQTQVSLLTGKGQFKVTPRKSARKPLRQKGKRRNRFKIRTVTAVVGVRGTEFVLGTSGSQTNLLTISGLVTIAPVEAPEIEVEVPENQASQVQQGLAPTPPIPVAAEIQEQIIQEDSPQVFNVVDYPPAPTIEKAREEQQSQQESEEQEEEQEQEEEEGVENEETVEEQETSIIQESPLEELPLDLDSLEEVQEQLDKTQEEVIEKEKQKVLELEIERE